MAVDIVAIGQFARGRLARVERPLLDVADRGLLYGLGLFETTLLVNSLPWLWEWHLERLLQSAGALDLPISEADLPPSSAIEEFAAPFAKLAGTAGLAVRLNATAGPEEGRPAVWIAIRRLRPARSPAHVAVSELTASCRDRFARHKAFHYGIRYEARRRAAAAGFDDALLCDDDGRLTEAAHANVFVRFGRQWCTPSLEGPVLAGTMRRLVLETAGREIGIVETAIPIETLAECDEMFLTNSVRGVIPVGRIGERDLSTADAVQLVRSLRLPFGSG